MTQNIMGEPITVILASNFLNHHMLPLCLELKKLTQDRFRFIATTELPAEREKLGYKKLNEEYDFVIRAYENSEEKRKAIKICNDCDILIYGSAPEMYYMRRLLRHKLTFRYSERVLKNPFNIKNIPKRIIKYIIRDVFTQNENHYLLAASAYASDDFNRFGAFVGRSLKWGYFPPIFVEDGFAQRDERSTLRILWVGRLIPYKKPEFAVDVAKELSDRGISYQMNIIGTGELEAKINGMIQRYNLYSQVNLMGAKPNDEVRNIMRSSEIFLFTSNEEEGWGAVLNEAMGSGCVCIAYKGIGAVPFLIEDGVNGFVFGNHSPKFVADLCEKVISDRSLRTTLSKRAKNTILDMWNAEVAARRLIDFANSIKNNKTKIYEAGPLSYAERLRCDANE